MSNLIIYTRPNRLPEREYILEVIFSHFLGISYTRIDHDEPRVVIEMAGKRLILEDTLFSRYDNFWLKPESMPQSPLPIWNSENIPPLATNLLCDYLPIIYSNQDKAQFVEICNDTIFLNFDLLGSCFFCLTRYEELVIHERDEHDRFLSKNSLASREGFLLRPIVNEYLEILWSYMFYLWPSLWRMSRQFNSYVSCDVDHLFDQAMYSPIRFVKRLCANLIVQHSYRRMRQTINDAINVRFKGRKFDPYQTFDWIMNTNEQNGNRCAFYFLCGGKTNYEGNYNLYQNETINLLCNIYNRNHEIGLHTSYNAYNDLEQAKEELSALQTALASNGIEQTLLGARQHYLKLKVPETLQIYDKLGIDYDTSMGYPDSPGFRAGTCYQFPFFDCLARKKLNIIERPLILMERSIISNHYMGLKHSSDSLILMKKLKEVCRKYNGDFTVLWHNSHFNDPLDKLFYTDLLQI